MEQETKICSNCKRAINVGTFDLHESHCVRHIKLCPVCDEPVPVREMEEHHNENHAPQPCEKCGQNVPPDQLEEHLEQSCAEVKVECKYCELDIRRADYPEHTDQCGSRTDFCEQCNVRVMLKDMSEHKLTKCGHMRAESPLQRYQLEGMGLVGQSEGESDSSDDLNPNYYPPHGIGHSTTPPPAYERRNDDSMHVDPYWLQTVAEACGEDNLDTLLAQNVFFENMRNVRSDGHYAASGPAVVSHDDHVTTEDSSEDEVREKPPHFAHGDNRLVDEDLSRELAVTKERDDFYLAQRMQEREVMGHSRTLYEEKRVREIARETEEKRRENSREREGEDNTREMEEEREKRRREVELEEDEEVKSKASDEVRKYEEELVTKQREMEELARKLEETKGEIDNLRLATQLQKEDLAEGHKALWRQTSHTSQLADESLARRLQIKEDKLQYGHTYLEGEEPRSKAPPTQSFADDTSEKIPCQWCEKLIPFEQVMLHQQSCYGDLYGDGVESGRGPRLNEDTFRRVEDDSESWQADQFKIECRYCHVSVPASNLTTHEALCESNPDIDLKNFYPSQLASSSAVREKPSLYSTPTTLHDNTDDNYQAQQFNVECEYCHVSILASNLSTHEALCSSNPNTHFKKFHESEPSTSSASAVGLSLSRDPPRAPPTTTSTMATSAEAGAGMAGASATLLSVEKGPCEFCHQVIPLAQLIRHQASCKYTYTRPKPSLAPPTSSQYSPAPPPSSPTLLQETTATVPQTSAGKRSLAIKFPGKDDHSDTTGHQLEERDGTAMRRLDPVVKPVGSSVANGSSSRASLSLSSLSRGKGESSKKRQSPSETFEPWADVREPVKKAPRTEGDGGSIVAPHFSSSLTARGVGHGVSSKKRQPVFASGSRRDVYGADSVERGGNVLGSAAAKGVPSKAAHQVRESRVKTDDATVKSVSAGMKKLALHSKSDTERKSLPTATKSKPHSIVSSTSSTSKTKSLQDGRSKFQITGTTVSGAKYSPHSNASRTTRTKSVGGNSSKLHSTPSLKSYTFGTSSTNRQTVAASSARGRGRGGDGGRGQSTGTGTGGTVLRQSSTGSTGSAVTKGKGRGGASQNRTRDKI